MNFNEYYIVSEQHRIESEKMLEEMLSTMVYQGRVDLAEQYLDKVKNTFSKYETWRDILGIKREREAE